MNNNNEWMLRLPGGVMGVAANGSVVALFKEHLALFKEHLALFKEHLPSFREDLASFR